MLGIGLTKEFTQSSAYFAYIERGSPSVTGEHVIAYFTAGLFDVGVVRGPEDRDLRWFEGIGSWEVELEGKVGRCCY